MLHAPLSDTFEHSSGEPLLLRLLFDRGKHNVSVHVVNVLLARLRWLVGWLDDPHSGS